MRRVRVLPYRQGSRSARALANALDGKVLRLEGSTFRPRRDDVIINWGNTDPPQPVGRFFNWAGLRAASNKLFFFQRMVEEGLANLIPQFWTRQGDIPDEAFPIVCRTVLAGHSGAGIVIADTRADLVDAPLYVKYIKKQQEWRIHVGRRGDQSIIITIQRKARNRNVPDGEVNWQVRNHANGFIYARNDGVAPPECVIEIAKQCFMATGLDFGAVDVIYNEREGRAYVLEINTAPGLEGQTVEDYAEFFRSVGFVNDRI